MTQTSARKLCHLFLCYFWLVLSSAGQSPSCSYTAISSRKIQIFCSILYVDTSYQPIDAAMTWLSNGSVYKMMDTPVRRKVGPYFVSTSSIKVDAKHSQTYECDVRFTAPRGIQYSYAAINAPLFLASCNSTCEFYA